MVTRKRRTDRLPSGTSPRERQLGTPLRDLGRREGSLPTDVRHRAEDEVQKLTDKYIDLVNQLLEAKENEIMEV